MNAHLATTKTSALCAVGRESQMRFTASNAQDWRRIETAVPKSSIWEAREPTCSTKRKISGITEHGTSGVALAIRLEDQTT